MRLRHCQAKEALSNLSRSRSRAKVDSLELQSTPWKQFVKRQATLRALGSHFTQPHKINTQQNQQLGLLPGRTNRKLLSGPQKRLRPLHVSLPDTPEFVKTLINWYTAWTVCAGIYKQLEPVGASSTLRAATGKHSDKFHGRMLKLYYWVKLQSFRQKASSEISHQRTKDSEIRNS